jgi:hypothetical protein
VKCMEDTLTKIMLKWLKKKKRRSEVRKSESLDEKTKENISTRKRDRGKIIKLKKPPIDDMENLVGKKDGQAGKS